MQKLYSVFWAFLQLEENEVSFIVPSGNFGNIFSAHVAQRMGLRIKNLHIACPDDLGDWYFSGNYPTPGGNKVVNQAFINYYEGSNKRAY